MRKLNWLLLTLLLLSGLSVAQNSSAIFFQVVQPDVPTGTGQPAPSAVYRVCTVSATGTPCNPTANIYLDPGLTTPITQPATSDQNGIVFFFAAPGNYQIQVNPIPTNPSIVYNFYGSASDALATVYSVGLSMPGSIFSVANSPITSMGTFIVSLNTQAADTVFGNCTGSTATPTFCSLVAGMIPSTLNSTTINGTLTTTTLAVTGNSTMGGTLTVTGSGTFNGLLTANASENVGGNLLVTNDLTVEVNAQIDSIISAGSFASLSANAAVGGIIRLANNETIAWRNAANNNDEAIYVDGGDMFVINAINGALTIGANPNLYLGGTASTNPALLRNGTTVAFRLGDNSNDAPISAALGTFSAHIKVDGVTCNLTSPSAGQILTAIDSTDCIWQSPDFGLQQVITQNLGSPVSIAGSPSATNVLQRVVTMPATGCPCRVLVAYNTWWSTTASGQFGTWMSDGTNVFASAGANQTGSTSNFSVNGSAMSPVTYGNSAAVTFTLVASQDGGGTVTVNTNSGIGAQTQPSFMNLNVFPNAN